MAQFNVFSSTGQSTDNLWPAAGGSNIASVITSTASEYTILLTNGTYVHYYGLFSGFGGFSPSGGFYTSIRITDVNGVIFASLSGILGNAADILNTPGASILAGIDSFTGSTGADVLHGFDGNDQFIVRNGDLVAGDVIDGGNNSDTILVSGDSASATTVNGRLATITSIENLQFLSNTINNTQTFTFEMEWAQVGTWASAINVIGRGDAFSKDVIRLGVPGISNQPNSVQTLDLSLWNFSNWEASDTVEIGGSSYTFSATPQDNVIGSSQNDFFNGWGGGDTFNGGFGDDTFVATVGAPETGTFNGGSGTDTIQFFGGLGQFQDLTGFTFASVEKLEFRLGGSVATMAASQVGTSLSSSFNLSSLTGLADNLRFDMGTANSLNLSAMTATNWSTQGKITIIGDADAETITGSIVNDEIISGGGLDTLDGLDGDDVFVIVGNIPGVKPVAAVLGGIGADTLQLNTTDVSNYFFNFTQATVQSIERVIFNNANNNSTVVFGSAQISTGLGQSFEIVGGSSSSYDNYFNILQSSGQVLDARGVTLTNWSTTDSFYLAGDISNAAIWGSSYNDTINDSAGSITIDAGNGDDLIRIVFDHVNNQATGSVTGGSGTNTLRVAYNDTAINSTIDIRQLLVTSINKFEFSNDSLAGFTLQTIAAQINGAFNNSTNTISGSANQDTLSIEMGLQSNLNLTNLQFSNWSANDVIQIIGDADSETIYGTSSNDRIISGGGSDLVVAGGGNDTIVMRDNATFAAPTFDGGTGVNTLELVRDPASISSSFNLNNPTISNMQVLAFGEGSAFAFITADKLALGFSQNLQINDLKASGDASTFFVDTNNTPTTLNMSGFTFQNWQENDTIYVTASAFTDTITGSSQNDIIDGSVGSDFLFGGAGDDQIFFDPTDLAANVDGGGGVDTLVVELSTFGVFAPISSYNLAAGHFEQAQVVQRDITNSQVWTRISDNYTVAWQKYLTTMVFDNNATRDTIYDYTNTQSYVTLRIDYDPSHMKTYQYYALDGGASFDTTYDYTPGINWSSLRNDYNAAGQRTYEYYIYDDGTSRDTTFDYTPGIIWKSLRNDYNATSQRTYEYYVYDDNSSRDTTFDFTPGILWKSLRNDYTAANQRTYEYYVYDDNSSRDTTFDFTPGVLWSSLRNDYDNQARQTYTYFVFDNGTQRDISQDYTAGIVWKSLTQNYDASAAHKLTDQYFVFDDNTARYVEFGTFAGHPGATSHTTNYADAAGTMYLNDFYT
jgi:Ca2+-binding RTX toxin-like protein